MSSISGMCYCYWDILKAPRIALSGKNLLAQGRALFYGYLIYLILTYVALLLDGANWSYIWSTYLLFPFKRLGFFNWYSKALWGVAVIQFLAFYFYGAMTVARLCFEELKGNYFFSQKTAAAEARASLRTFWVAILVLLLLIVVLSLLQAVVGLIALIPTVGEIIYAVIYGLPLFVWSLFVVMIIFGLSTAMLTLPAIVTVKERDSFGATFHIFNVIWTQPLRWVSLTAISLVLAKVGTFVLGYFFMRSLQLSNYVATLFAGDKINTSLSVAFGMLAQQRWGLGFLTSLYPGSCIAFDWIQFAGPVATSGSSHIAALIIYATLVLLALVVITFGLNTITCGQVIAFLLVRYHEDNEKLTDELVITETTADGPADEGGEKSD